MGFQLSVEVGRLLERQSDIERISIIIDQQPILLEARRMEDAADKSVKNAETIAAKIMNDAGYDVEPFEMDLSSREDILALIAMAQVFGEIKYLVNAAGVSPSQASIESILKVDLYGTAVLLEEAAEITKVTGGLPAAENAWNRSRVMRSRGDREGEIACLNECIPVFEREYGETHSKTMRAKERL